MLGGSTASISDLVGLYSLDCLGVEFLTDSVLSAYRSADGFVDVLAFLCVDVCLGALMLSCVFCRFFFFSLDTVRICSIFKGA